MCSRPGGTEQELSWAQARAGANSGASLAGIRESLAEERADRFGPGSSV